MRCDWRSDGRLLKAADVLNLLTAAAARADCALLDACMNDVDIHWPFTRLLICTRMVMAMQIYRSFARRMARQAVWRLESTGATVEVKVDLKHWFSVSR